jgi:hypothetical protein
MKNPTVDTMGLNQNQLLKQAVFWRRSPDLLPFVTYLLFIYNE